MKRKTTSKIIATGLVAAMMMGTLAGCGAAEEAAQTAADTATEGNIKRHLFPEKI